MVTKRQKQVAGVASAALLLFGSVFAWANVTQHKTNESLGDSSSPNDVTLVENFEPTDSWEKGAEKLKEISVKNNGKTEKGAEPVYVRINLKEYLEFTKKEEVFSDVRYAVKTDSEFAKFESEADAKVYAAANGLSEADVVLVPKTVHEGDNQYFIKTKEGAFHGQYGKFLLLEMKADWSYTIKVDTN